MNLNKEKKMPPCPVSVEELLGNLRKRREEMKVSITPFVQANRREIIRILDGQIAFCEGWAEEEKEKEN